MCSLKRLLACWTLMFLVVRYIVPTLSVSCKGFGHHNPPSEWFLMYKLPRKIDDDDKLVQRGTAFLYMTSTQHKWAFSEIGIDENYTPIYNTLQQIYDRPTDSGLDFGMYNDQPPNTERTANVAGQTKGAFAFDELGGFWMITSTPRFPMPYNEKGKYVFPERFLKSSQMIFCISLAKDQRQTLKKSIFPITLPYNYSGVWDIPERSPPASSIMVENVGTGYIFFAKHRSIEEDVYEYARRKLSRRKMTVHTTTTSTIDLENNHMHQVRLLSFMLPLPKPHVLQWMSSSDNTKWAVTNEFICIGDLNRNAQQLSRGGGLLCMKNREVATQFETLVTCSSVQKEDVSYLRYMLEIVTDLFVCCFWPYDYAYYGNRMFCWIMMSLITVVCSVTLVYTWQNKNRDEAGAATDEGKSERDKQKTDDSEDEGNKQKTDDSEDEGNKQKTDDSEDEGK